MLFETEGGSDLRICISSNQVTCTTTACLVQGCETTAQIRHGTFSMPKAIQMAIGSFYVLTLQNLSPVGSHLHKHPEEMASWKGMWLLIRNIIKTKQNKAL